MRGLDELEFAPGATFLAGENGAGKSALLEAMAIRMGATPERGSIHFRFSTFESHSPLSKHLPRRPPLPSTGRLLGLPFRP